MEMYAQDWNTQASTNIRLHKKNAKLHLKQTPLHILKLHQLKKKCTVCIPLVLLPWFWMQN